MKRCFSHFTFRRLPWTLFFMGKVLFFILFFPSWSYPYKPTLRSPEVFSVRNIGMGWAYTAVANDESILHSNPAGIGVRQKLFQIKDDEMLLYFLPAQFGFSELFFSGLSVGNVNLKFPTDPGYSFKLSSPSDFVYAGNFWAISFISRGLYDNVQDSRDNDTYYQSKFFSQIKAGFKLHSFSLVSYEDFHIAMAAKVMYLMQVNKQLTKREVNQREGNIDYNSDADRKRRALLYGEALNFFEGFAIGIDLGLLWEIHLGDSGHQINLGIMVEDAPSYGFSVEMFTDTMMRIFFPRICSSSNKLRNIPEDQVTQICEYYDENFNGSESAFFQVNGRFGIAYMLPDYNGGFFSDTMLAFDIHRIGDLDYDFSRMYHVGFSTTVFDMVDPRTGYSYRLNLSAGVSQNQFNAGYLVHLNVFQIGYNYFREKLLEVDEVNQRHTFTFAFYF